MIIYTCQILVRLLHVNLLWRVLRNSFCSCQDVAWLLGQTTGSKHYRNWHQVQHSYWKTYSCHLLYHQHCWQKFPVPGQQCITLKQYTINRNQEENLKETGVRSELYIGHSWSWFHDMCVCVSQLALLHGLTTRGNSKTKCKSNSWICMNVKAACVCL